MATNGPVYGGYNKWVSVTKSDTVNIPGPNGRVLTDALWVGGAGIVVAVAQDDSTAQFTCTAGTVLPIACKRVNSGTTSATLVVALYHV